MLEIIVPAFVTLFVTIDPVSMIPIFISLTAGTDRKHRIRMAWRACIIAAVVLFLFGLIGDALLDNFGITLPAFRVAGGILLFIIALEMLFANRNKRKSKNAEEIQHEIEEPEDISVFPLAIPLICGPGAIASIMLLMSDHSGNLTAQSLIMAMMFAVILITGALFLIAVRFHHFIGPTISNILTRVLGILLAALAIQYIFDGLQRGLLSN